LCSNNTSHLILTRPIKRGRSRKKIVHHNSDRRKIDKCAICVLVFEKKPIESRSVCKPCNSCLHNFQVQ
jgi:hypothetical protein